MCTRVVPKVSNKTVPVSKFDGTIALWQVVLYLGCSMDKPAKKPIWRQ